MKTRILNWIVRCLVAMALIAGWSYGLQQHRVAAAAQNEVEVQAQKLKETKQIQDGKLANLLLGLQNGMYGFRYEPYPGGVIIRPMDGSTRYFKAKLGSEDITVEFSDRPSMTSQR